MQALYLMSYVTGHGHPNCLICHEHWQNSRELGIHAAREMLYVFTGKRPIP